MGYFWRQVDEFAADHSFIPQTRTKVHDETEIWAAFVRPDGIRLDVTVQDGKALSSFFYLDQPKETVDHLLERFNAYVN